MQKKTGSPAEANDPVSKIFKLNTQVLKPETIQLETITQSNFNVSHSITIIPPSGGLTSWLVCIRR